MAHASGSASSTTSAGTTESFELCDGLTSYRVQALSAINMALPLNWKCSNGYVATAREHRDLWPLVDWQNTCIHSDASHVPTLWEGQKTGNRPRKRQRR